jgi:RNA polymerase sigma-70 factor (ECF subfamily)
LAEFFNEYFDRIYNLAVRWCGNRSDAEDLTQDVFLRVQRSIHTLDASRNPWPWLLSIARNRLSDWGRSHAHRVASQAVPFEDEPHPPSAGRDAPDPKIAVQQREQEEFLQRALQALPPDQRLVVMLRDFEGLSHASISEVAGMTESNARKCYSRAIAALGRRMRRVMP